MKKEWRNILKILIIAITISLISGYLFYNFLCRKYWGVELSSEIIAIGFSSLIFYNTVTWLYMILEEKDSKRKRILNGILVIYLFVLIVGIINLWAYSGVCPFSFSYYKDNYLWLYQLGTVPLVVFLIWYYLKRKKIAK